MTNQPSEMKETEPGSAPETIKKAAYSLSYGVYLITTANASNRSGMTAVWVSQVSKQPIRIGIGITPESYTAGQILENRLFCVNVLPEHLKDLAYRFGSSAISMEEKFNNLKLSASPEGQPVLDDSFAWMECRVESVQDMGTHLWITGKVTAAGTGSGNPAIYNNGEINGFHSL